ncbi:MAG TPA: FAD-binding oxidoreductase [Nocardioides sp.]|jgi:FAD/FMN-containing dehydrogenase|nr:FAD-binding oxidoreductase [Nocardioides sp.]
MSLDHLARQESSVDSSGLRLGIPAERVHLPGDASYDGARMPWNVAVDQRPAAVAYPRNADEVSAVVRAAAEAGLRVAPQSTGHNAGPLAARGLDDVVVLRTSDMNLAIADPEAGIVRVEGGAIWEPAVQAAAAYDRAVLHGSSPDVGIAGYTLGGGIGWYARTHGLATNSLTAVELVIGDGTQVRASADENPALFWALRGGGGSFGVVTALELRTFPISSAYAGMMIWDISHAESVLREWSSWAPTAPDAISTSFRILRLPPMEELPPFLRGRSVVVIDGAALGTDQEGAELVAGLRALRPEIDTFGRQRAADLVRLHMDPEGPSPFRSGSTMLGGLPDAGVDAFLEQVGPDATSSLLMAELRQLGGALARPHEGGGVLSHLEGDFVTFAGGIAATPELGEAAYADAQALSKALEPWANGRQYLNFAEDVVDPRTAYQESAWTQLAGIRSAVDPEGVFAANHPVPRLYEGGSPAV